jgi:hypothetical protein
MNALDDHRAELLGILQAALHVDLQLQFDPFGVGRAADDAGRHLHVLTLDRGHHLQRRQPRTECCCHPVVFMMAAIVVPCGRLNIAITLACLEPARGWASSASWRRWVG